LITYLERIIEFDLARATEAAALNALTWMGKGDKDAAGSGRLWRDPWDVRSDSVLRRVVVGEGAKDEALGIFPGEQLDTWAPGTVAPDIAVDPVDGTTKYLHGAAECDL
jgi:fructose-1,6-bisphosphatase II